MTDRGRQRPKTENPVGARILDALGDRGLAWLSQASGVPNNTLRDYVRDGIRTADNGLKIAAALGVSLDWLFTGRDGPPSPAAEEDLVSLPMLTPSLSAGGGTEAAGRAVRQADWLFPRAWLRRSFGHDDQLELLRVQGDSMVPDLHDGDWVMVDRTRRDPRDGLYALRLDDALLVKRIQFQGRTIRVVSSNPAYQPIDLDRQDESLDLEILGRIVWSSKVHVAA